MNNYRKKLDGLVKTGFYITSLACPTQYKMATVLQASGVNNKQSTYNFFSEKWVWYIKKSM